MKKLITNYTFDASAKTVNFNDYTGSFDIKGLLLIVNITDNITIYNFAVDGVGYTAIDDDLVTLEYNTTSMDDADKLLIYYDDGANQVVELGSTDNAVLDAMVVDLAALEVLSTAANVDLAAIEVLLTAANVDHAANEVLLGTIDADTNAIKGHVDGIEGLLTTIDADTSAIKTSVELLDNAIDGNYLNVNANIAGTDLVGGAGAVAGGVQRVTLASDDPAVTDLAAIEVLLTAANVDHAANEVLLGTIDADTNAIKGHVDGIETLITATNSKIDTFDAVLDNILTKNTEIDAVLDTIKVDTEAIETAVELLDNAIDGNEMQVDIVSAPTITVDGTVTANLSSTDNAVLDAMVVDLAAIEVLLTSANTDHAANEVLLTGIDEDTNAIKGHVDGIEALLTTIDEDTNAIKTAVQILDDWDDSNYANINMNIAGTDVDGGSGDKSAQSQRVVIATDDIPIALVNTNLAAIETTLETIKVDTEAIETAVELLDNAIDGSEMQVDIVSAPTITVTGTVTANLSATDNAVLDTIDSVLDTIKVDTEAIETAVEAIQVDAASIEVLLTAANVDHAANEALLATIDADTGAIKTAVELIDNAIDGSEMQVDVVASLPAGTNNIGDVDIASALPAGNNNIGNVDIASALPAGSNAIGKLAANSGVDIGDVDVTSTVQPVGHGTVSHVAQNVTDSAVQLGSNACKHVDIMATIANTGIVYIGASGVSATTGIALYPGDVYSVDITNTNLLYTISTVSGDDINMVIYS